MQDFVILDTNVGLLQWSGTASDKAAALGELAAIVGDDPYSLDDGAFVVLPVTQWQRQEIESWCEAGGKAADTPEWLPAIRRRLI